MNDIVLLDTLDNKKFSVPKEVFRQHFMPDPRFKIIFSFNQTEYFFMNNYEYIRPFERLKDFKYVNNSFVCIQGVRYQYYLDDSEKYMNKMDYQCVQVIKLSDIENMFPVYLMPIYNITSNRLLFFSKYIRDFV